MPSSNSIRRTMFVVFALGLAACGGGDNVQDHPAHRREESTVVDADSKQASDEARAQEELLATGLSARIAFRNPEFALLDFFKGRQLFERETFDGNGRTCLTCHSRAS
jgi:hypothetical protein